MLQKQKQRPRRQLLCALRVVQVKGDSLIAIELQTEILAFPAKGPRGSS